MWVIRRRTLIVCSLLLATVIALVSVLSVHLINMAGEDALMTVVIDAGHGGVDGGAVGINTGVKESDLNLKLARELQSQFHAAGFAVVMTRRDENGLYGNLSEGYKRRDMQRRREIILEANPVLVLSIHLNKYSQEYRRGAQVFFDAENAEGKSLAHFVQDALNNTVNTRAYTELKGDYYMLNSHPYPAAIVECGFLSNPDEEALLQTEDYRRTLCAAIFSGAIGYLMSQHGTAA